MELKRFDKPVKVLINGNAERWAVGKKGDEILHIPDLKWDNEKRAFEVFEEFKSKSDYVLLASYYFQKNYKLIKCRVNKVEE